MIENLTAEKIDNSIEELDECGDEEKYLLRVASLEALLVKEFNLEDESYINALIDEIYPELYE